MPVWNNESIILDVKNGETVMESEIRKYIDEIYNESTTLPENFGEAIVTELKNRFTVDGYEITKQTVLEEMLWCYMCRMQWNKSFNR